MIQNAWTKLNFNLPLQSDTDPKKLFCFSIFLKADNCSPQKYKHHQEILKEELDDLPFSLWEVFLVWTLQMVIPNVEEHRGPSLTAMWVILDKGTVPSDLHKTLRHLSYLLGPLMC